MYVYINHIVLHMAATYTVQTLQHMAHSIHTRTDTHTCTHTDTHTCTHTDTHTHTYTTHRLVLTNHDLIQTQTQTLRSLPVVLSP